MLSYEQIIELHNRQIIDYAISHDNNLIAYVYGNHDMLNSLYSNDIMDREIGLLDCNNSRHYSILPKGIDAHSPFWSHDNKKIAFLALYNGKTQVFIYDLTGSSYSNITDIKYDCPNAFDGCFKNARLFWSPDDKYIVTSFLPYGSEYYLSCTLPIVKSESEIFHESSENSGDYSGFIENYKQSILIINSATGEIIQSELLKKKFILRGLINKDTVIYSQNGKLYKFNITNNLITTLNYDDMPVIKLSGEKVLYAGVNGKKIFFGVNNEEIANTEIEADYIKAVDVSSNGSFAVFVFNKKMTVHLLKINSSGKIDILTNEYDYVFDGQVQAAPTILNNDDILFLLSNTTTHHEFYKISNAEKTKILFFNDEILRKTEIACLIKSFKNEEDDIETILLLPPKYKKHVRYPALIYLHGGPNVFENATISNMIDARGRSAAYALCQEGFVVAMPNYRGTLGYGKKHTENIPNASMEYIEYPFEDTLACRDFLINEYNVDPNRIGIYGSSFGAQITGWSITHSNNFYAAACIVGVEYDLEFWYKLASKSERYWVEKDEKFTRYSIVNYISNISCPVLIVETGQAEGKKYTGKVFYNALCAYKKKAERVIYPNAFHNGGWTDEYKADYIYRLINFFK